MPELPEVRNVCNLLNQTTKNKIIKNVNINLSKVIKNVDEKTFKKNTEGKKILSVFNIGKWIVFEIENDYKIIVHLRLEGKFRNVFEGQNPKHDHIVFNFTDNTKLYFNDSRQFGTFHLLKGDISKQKPFSSLGKEPQETDVDEFLNKLSRKRIPIKSSLLDQTLLVGLGNIYVNEVLWKEKIHPERPSNMISRDELSRILKRSYTIMEASYKLGGSTISSYVSLNSKEGSFQNFLQVHMKKGKECPRCKDIILKKPVGGRGTYYCSSCQR